MVNPDLEGRIRTLEALLQEAMPLLRDASLAADEHGWQVAASSMHTLHEKIARSLYG